MVQPGAEKEGVGLGVLRMIKPWTEWMLMWGYEVAAGPPEFTDEFVRELAVKLVGTDDFEMRVTSTSPWTVNHHFATTIASGRVFCVGDAVHRHPPTNGLGSNTSIQDSYNLAWKLHHVVQGLAAPSLLDSYDAERAPVARQIVERANQSIADTGRIIAALDVDDTTDTDRLDRQLALRLRARPRGREDPASACARRSPTRHTSSTLTASSTTIATPRRRSSPTARRCRRSSATRSCTPSPPPGPAPSCRTPGSPARGTACRPSTSAGHGAFSLWTGIGGQAWIDAADAFAAETGLPITDVSIGPGQPLEDPYGTWAELREISDGGVLLVRPDLYVAARHHDAPDVGSRRGPVAARSASRKRAGCVSSDRLDFSEERSAEVVVRSLADDRRTRACVRC